MASPFASATRTVPCATRLQFLGDKDSMLRSFQAVNQIGLHIGSSILRSFPFPIAFWQLHCGFLDRS
ncbi:hypothetical protein ACFX10_033998 [Malus domestica]